MPENQTDKSYHMDVISVKLADTEPILSGLTGAKMVAKTFHPVMSQFEREQIAIINMDDTSRPVNVTFAAADTLTGSAAMPPELFRASILSNASAIIMIHNRSSGDVAPSKEDIKLTELIKKTCDLMEIAFLDHVIIKTEKEFYSFQEHHQIPKKEPVLKLPSHDGSFSENILDMALRSWMEQNYQKLRDYTFSGPEPPAEILVCPLEEPDMSEWLTLPMAETDLTRALQKYEKYHDGYMIKDYLFRSDRAFIRDHCSCWTKPAILNLLIKLIGEKSVPEAFIEYCEYRPYLTLPQMVNAYVQSDRIAYEPYRFDGAEYADSIDLSRSARYGYHLMEQEPTYLRTFTKYLGNRTFASTVDVEDLGRRHSEKKNHWLGKNGFIKLSDPEPDLSLHRMREYQIMYQTLEDPNPQIRPQQAIRI